MTENESYPRAKPSRLIKIRNLAPDTKGPVRILCIVIQSKPGSALVQDLLHDNIDDAKVIPVLIEGELTVNEKYILIGEITERKTDGEKTMVFSASLAHNVNHLDIMAFKDALAMRRKIEDTLSR